MIDADPTPFAALLVDKAVVSMVPRARGGGKWMLCMGCDWGFANAQTAVDTVQSRRRIDATCDR